MLQNHVIFFLQQRRSILSVSSITIVDAWGLDLQNDILFVKINVVPFHLIYL